MATKSYADGARLHASLPRPRSARALRVLDGASSSAQTGSSSWQRGKEWCRSSLRAFVSGAGPHPREAWLGTQLQTQLVLSPDGEALAVVSRRSAVFRFAASAFDDRAATRCAIPAGVGKDMDARARCVAWSDSSLLAVSCAPTGDPSRVVVIDAITGRVVSIVPLNTALVAPLTHPLWIGLRRTLVAAAAAHEVLALSWSGALLRAAVAPLPVDGIPSEIYDTVDPPHPSVDLCALTQCRSIGAVALCPLGARDLLGDYFFY